MTIAEIESIVRELRTRHENLDEEMLITLLTAGGWENKVINDALIIFKGLEKKNNVTESIVTTLVVPKTENNEKPPVANVIDHEAVLQPQLEKIEVVSPQINEEILTGVQTKTQEEQQKTADIVYYKAGGEEEEGPLPTPIEEIKSERVEQPPSLSKMPSEVEPVVQEIVVPQIEKEIKKEVLVDQSLPPQREPLVPIIKDSQSKSEPQSLIEEKKEIVSRVVPPPPNLPLKPFESSPHVWPFSKYKEVFHGETMPSVLPEEKVLVVTPSLQKEELSKKSKQKRTGFDSEDEGLILLTGISLFFILLLLAYMYSNGRL